MHLASGDLWAGAEVQLYTLAKRLHKTTDTAVTVVLLNHGRLEQQLLSEGIAVTVLDETRLNGLQIFVRLVKLLKEVRPDVVHTHRLKENILGSLAALLAGNIPSIRTVHGAPEYHVPWRKLTKKMIHICDGWCGRYLQKRIVAVTYDLEAILATSFPRTKLTVIENGIEIETISGTNSPQRRTKSTNKIDIAFAGRLVPIKRVDLVIETAKYLQDNHPDLEITFHIFGDGPLKEPLETLSQNCGTEKIVRFEGHCDDIYPKLKEMDILLMTSDHEGLPMILLEAMALRLAIVAHAVGGIPRLLDNGECGELVSDQNSARYGEAIANLINSPAERECITESAFSRLKIAYTAERNAMAYDKIYRAISNS